MINTPKITNTPSGKIGSVQASVPQGNTLSSVPPSLLLQPVESIIKATVVGRDPNGATLLKTPQGTLSLNTPLNLPTGSAVQLRVISNGNNLELLITSINGKPPAEVLQTQDSPASPVAPQAKNPVTYTPQDLTFRTNTQATSQPSIQPEAPAPFPPAIQTQVQGLQEGRSFPAILTALHPEVLTATLTHFQLDPQSRKIIPQTLSASAAPQAQLPDIRPGYVVTVRIISGTVPSIPATLETPPPTTPQNPLETMFPSPLKATIPPGKLPYASPLLPTFIINPEQPAQLPSSAALPASAQPLPTNPAGAAQSSLPATGTTPAAYSNVASSAVPLAPDTIPEKNPQPLPASPILPKPDLALPGAITALPRITGQVIGTEKSGDTVIHTPIGTLKLALETPLPKNTLLTLELVAIAPPPAPILPSYSTTTAAKSDGIPQLMQHWASLEEVVDTLQSDGKTQADTLLREILPAPDKNLGARLLKFITAIQTGDITQWLGQPVIASLKEKQKHELLTTLSKEFATLRAAFTEPSHGNWQTLFFPVYNEGVLHQARMYLRYNKEEESKKEAKTAKNAPEARFIVEVDLEQLGAMQLDGLVHHTRETKFFDLVVRSHKTLPNIMRKDIIDIFTSAQETTGLNGRLSFEAIKPFPVNPAQESLNFPEQGGTGSIIA